MYPRTTLNKVLSPGLPTSDSVFASLQNSCAITANSKSHFDEIAEERDSNPNPWTHVVYGRCSSCSPTSSVITQFSQQSIQSKSTVTRVHNEYFPELGRGVGFHGTPIATANAALTPEQQESIRRWAEIVDIISNGNESEDSADDQTKGEGPSSGKGKATDPRNWGATHLSDEELDADEQRHAFKFWNRVKKEKAIELQALYDIQNNINTEPPASMRQEPVVEREIKQESFSVPIPSPVVRRRPKVTIEDVVDDDEIEYLGRQEVPQENVHPVKVIKPAKSQIQPRAMAAPLSNLMEQQIEDVIAGRLKHGPDQIEPTSHLGQAMNGCTGMVGKPGDGPPDDEPSDSSDFSSSSRDDDLPSDDGSHRPKRKLILKPVAPAKYNGEPNSELFLTFMDDVNAYLREGGVPQKDRVRKIGAFLTGKAQQFYHSMIRDQARHWHLKPFFKELYNYCFPLTYRMEQRRLWMRAFQNERTVREYDAILHQFFNTIGITGEREMVNRLWTGLRNEIQVGLWRERLHPKYSSYTEVLEAAELIEIIENISKAQSGTRNHKGTDNQPTLSGNGKGNDNPPYPPKNRSSHKPHKGFKPSKDSRSQTGPSGNSSGNWNKPKPPPKRPELSKKEKEHQKAEGLCFCCGKSGHMSHQCPDGKTVKSGKSTSPPGLTSANVNINIEHLRELAETTEDIHELKVGMINTWLDSLEADPNVYESQDESPVLETVLESSDSETEGNSHRMEMATNL
ncbi:hypothetical protein IW261DRAFT_1576434 [Armillaria novae-zelandiae]|uniref:CCHC-type domain-containing protein n=1 Tax=Armillaria novae-zelandiae TaxID=153914 RepID=A0AA39T3P3_9AGAR|nr:hypothetical protein IW261DRAFT_1576434 [Armillaria novae-zelandiae]